VIPDGTLRCVILGAAHDYNATPDSLMCKGTDGDWPLSYCTCGQEGCWRCQSRRWNVQIHNPDIYTVRQGIERTLEEQGRMDVKDLFRKACIGLDKGETQALGRLLLAGLKLVKE
jgi:hypothetical protein